MQDGGMVGLDGAARKKQPRPASDVPSAQAYEAKSRLEDQRDFFSTDRSREKFPIDDVVGSLIDVPEPRHVSEVVEMPDAGTDFNDVEEVFNVRKTDEGEEPIEAGAATDEGGEEWNSPLGGTHETVFEKAAINKSGEESNNPLGRTSEVFFKKAA